MKIKMFFSIIGDPQLKGSIIIPSKKELHRQIDSLWDAYKEGENKSVLLVFSTEP